MKRLLLVAILFAAVLALPIQADFFQCVGLVVCIGSNNADVMNGSLTDDDINGQSENDIIFSRAGRDVVDGDKDDDIIFSGLGSDRVFGELGDDMIAPGPDDEQEMQFANGNQGNDSFFVFVGETSNCQFIVGETGFDVLQLIGFGPYVAEYPYGAAEPIVPSSFIIIQDPIASGYVFIDVEKEEGSSIERIIGLASPVVTVVDSAGVNVFVDKNCTFSPEP
jgi:Ca2+-binding RTX toxin-like protein